MIAHWRLTEWNARRYFVTIGLLVVLIGAVWWNQNRGLKAVARETHGALCALQNDIQLRRDASVEYLEENPRGVVSPVTGAVIISAAQIRQGIANQESTLKALASELDC